MPRRVRFLRLRGARGAIGAVLVCVAIRGSGVATNGQVAATENSAAQVDSQGAEPKSESPVDIKSFESKAKVVELDVPIVGDAKKRDTNFSGVAFNPASRTLWIVDNEPNVNDSEEKPDQGDLYEFDVDGKFLRHIDLAGFSDPEAIAFMGADPKRENHDLFVIAEERIGTLAVVSIPRGKDEIAITRGEAGRVIVPNPNPIDDENNEPNDGLEGVAYDPQRDVFYVLKEAGSNCGIYRVDRDGHCAPLKVAGLLAGVAEKSEPLKDLADIQFHRGRLFVVSEISNRVVAIQLGDEKSEVIGQFPPLGELLPHKQPEGIAVADDGESLWIVGEPREFVRYRQKDR